MQILNLSMKRVALLSCILVFVALLSTLGTTRSGAQGTNENIVWACRHNKTSVIIIADGDQCPTGYTSMNWSIQGEPGPQGPPGNDGPQGSVGSVGPQGPAGDTRWQQSGSGIYYSAGNVGIGTTSPGSKLTVLRGGDAKEDNVLSIGDVINGTTYDMKIFAGSSKAGFVAKNSDGETRIILQSGNVDVAGSIHASNFPSSSDARLKTNVTQLTDVLPKLEQIRGVSFDWNELYKSMSHSTGQREIGVIAQEVEAVYPELVTTWGSENYRAVDYGRLNAVLIEAIKELRAEKDDQITKLQIENATLQSEVTDLHGQITDLDARLTALEQKTETVETPRK